MFGLGAQELMLILLIALVLFGGSKIPELGRSLGAGDPRVQTRRGEPGRGPRAQAGRRAAGRTDRSRRDAGRLGRRECLTPGRPRL